jgi:hypothetical protein
MIKAIGGKEEVEMEGTEEGERGRERGSGGEGKGGREG